MLRAAAEDLRAEAEAADERRLLVCSGERAATVESAREAVDGAGIAWADVTLVSERDALPCERIAPGRVEDLLGTTRTAVVLDCHDACAPNALGSVVGCVDGGGLLVLLCPPLEEWPDRRDGFDETLAAPPFDVSQVTGRFRRRLVATLRAHRGVAVYDADAGRLRADGRTDPAPRLPRTVRDAPAGARFPAAAYEACLTDDQVEAVFALEALTGPDPAAVVVEADRGRGKSAAAGLAAASLAAEGRDVLVTAPRYRNAREVFVRARALLDSLDALAGTGGDPPRSVTATGGGRVRFDRPARAVDLPGDPDAVVVDEAAALPVDRLAALLAADSVAFATTVHGYEGAGRGFDVRFRDHLADARHEVVPVTMTEPVRYAAADPVESWAFHALLLDARPAVAPLVADADPETATYRRLDAEELAADEHLLREAFGLLVVAHYRTEPDDLARLLDAPNLAVRALTHDGHVVSVALLAREGGLSAATRAAMYEGQRVRGNMLPDVLTSQLRDEDAGAPVGWRVVRIATHDAVRSRGLGSRLLGGVREEFGADADWLGVGYGATPDLLEFWRANGYGTVHLSTTRNDRSGEHSALMLCPTSAAGRALHDRHAAWFAERVVGMLSDALRDADPDVVRGALRATDADPDPALDAEDWRLVASVGGGAAIYSVDPRPFRELAAAHLVDERAPLTDRQERLLVRVVLQARDAASAADELGYHSRREAMQALGEACAALVEASGPPAAREELDRHREA